MLLGEIDWNATRLVMSYLIAIAGILVGHFSIPGSLGVVWWRRRGELGRLRLLIGFACLIGLSGVMAWLDTAMYGRMGNTNLYALMVFAVACLRAFAALYIIRVTLWIMSETQAAKARADAKRYKDLYERLQEANEDLDSAWRSEMQERAKVQEMVAEKAQVIATLEKMIRTRAKLTDIELTVLRYKESS